MEEVKQIQKTNIKNLNPDYFRNLIFGAEDSLVSTVGVLFGIASAGLATSAILVTGLIVIAVEALSMGAGAYLSEKSTHELEDVHHTDNPVVGGFIMFFSYFFAGFIPLLPYAFMPAETARFASAAIGLVALFVLGFLPHKSLKGGLRMAVVAGSAILIGYFIGHFFNANFEAL